MAKVVSGRSHLDKSVIAWVESLSPGLSDNLLGYEIKRRVNGVGTITLELMVDSDVFAPERERE